MMKKKTKSNILGGSKRTRQVFGVNPWVKLLGYVLIAAVVVMGLYLLLSADKYEKAIKEAEEETEEVVEETKAIVEEEPEEEEETVKEEIEEESIVYDYDHPYGDTSMDSDFSDNCKRFINNLKSDIDSLYEYKLKAQESYDEALAELKDAEDNLNEANENLDKKRQSLEESRQSCIESGSPN
jgi:hypothetical protein